MQISSRAKGVLPREPSRGLLCRPIRLFEGHAFERAARVFCAAPSKEKPESSTTNSMPRLPPRKEAQPPASPNPPADPTFHSQKSSSSSRSRPKRLGSFGGGPNQPPPSEPPHSAMQEKALAGLLALTGLKGTVATAVAFFVPGVYLFGGFHWDAADLSLALKLMLPVYGLNLLIMLPNYSSWKLPEVTAESQAAMVEAIGKWSARKGSKGSSSAGTGSIGSSEQRASAAPGAAAATGVAPGAAAGALQQPPMQREDVAPQSAAAVDVARESSSSSTVASEASTPASTPMPTSRSHMLRSVSSSSEAGDHWLDKQLKSPSIMRMRDALFMAQGHYLSLNPAVVLPLPLQAVVLLADCLAAELLYRSVALQLAGSWIGDRMVESGVDDAVEALLAGLPVLPTHASGQLVAVALLSAASGVLVLRSMLRMARRPELVLGAQGRQAAGQLLTDLQDRQRQQQRQQQKQQESSNSSDPSSSSSGPASQPVDKADSSSSAQQQQQQQQQQQSASRAAADWAVAAAKATARPPQQQQQQQGVPPPDPQWSRRIPTALSGLALSQLVQGTRDIGQMTALGLSFVLTGNLAAPFAAAVVNQALMAVLQKRGLERARQRSIAMAKHLAGITRQLRHAQRKQEEKERQQQQEQQQLAMSARSGQDVEPAATAEGACSSSTGSASITAAAAAEAGAAVQGAAAGSSQASAAAAPPKPDSPAVPVAAAAAPVDAAPAGDALDSRMERTINMLDQLLGQLGEHAPAGPGPGK